jgi:hypothetical protein
MPVAQRKPHRTQVATRGMTFMSDMHMSLNMSAQQYRIASAIGAFGTTPCSFSFVKAGVSSTSFRITYAAITTPILNKNGIRHPHAANSDGGQNSVQINRRDQHSFMTKNHVLSAWPDSWMSAGPAPKSTCAASPNEKESVIGRTLGRAPGGPSVSRLCFALWTGEILGIRLVPGGPHVCFAID